MRVKTRGITWALGTAGGVALAAAILLVGTWMGDLNAGPPVLSSGAAAPATQPVVVTAYVREGQNWDHKLSCKMHDGDGAGKEVGEVFLWVRNDDSRHDAARYLLATDATFTTSRYVPGGYPLSYWRNVEQGKGSSMCLDGARQLADGTPVTPYCAAALNLGTMEFRTMAAGEKDVERGLCTVLSSPPSPSPLNH